MARQNISLRFTGRNPSSEATEKNTDRQVEEQEGIWREQPVLFPVGIHIKLKRVANYQCSIPVSPGGTFIVFPDFHWSGWHIVIRCRLPDINGTFSQETEPGLQHYLKLIQHNSCRLTMHRKSLLSPCNIEN
jgi:hypothetical protein